MRKIRLLSTYCLVVLLASGCAAFFNPTPFPLNTPLAPVQTWTDTAAPYPLPSTPRPSPPTPILTDTPLPPTRTIAVSSPTPGLEPNPLIKIVPADLTEGNTLLHDLILIESRYFPFDYDKYHIQFHDLIETKAPDDYALWAISPDGTRMGRLTPLGLNTLLFLPAASSQKPLIVEYGIHLNNPELIAVPLPAECYAYTHQPLDPDGNPNTCRFFKFSEDGRYLSYTSNNSNCSRTLSILEVATLKVVYQRENSISVSEFLPNGKVFVTVGGSCEGGGTLLVDLKTGKEQEAGGYAWEYNWNSTHTAFLVQVGPYQGYIGRSFWGYSVPNDHLFSLPASYSSDTPATWTPDGAHILYEHREFIPDEKNNSDIPKAPGQIMLMDLATGQSRIILADPRYDYWLCERGQYTNCHFEGPDWVQVKRYPVPTDPSDLASYQASVIECLQSGNCLPDPELMALNWKTGALLPWSQVPAAPPTLTPTSQPYKEGSPRPPDPAQKPLYAHPSGDYAFYVGADGGSLWKVFKNNQPVLWAHYADLYIYLP